jgi:predicted KAP-like P-loop ATPase
LRAGSAVGAGIDLAGGAGAGAVASGAMNWVSNLIKEDDTVEKLHADLVKALGEQKKRFLIVIDDIDRLAPDEALLIFRLVKSVGRLPNVIYLLVFDRKLAEKIVSDRYPSEGPHYLEKIIQAGFDIPEPRQSELSSQLLEQVDALCGSPSEREMVRFMNVFYDVVLPEIKTPRDLVRLMNALSVTWPSVGRDVDQTDFIGLETLRVFRPDIHRALRSAKVILCGAGGMGVGQSARDRAPEYERRLLAELSEDKKNATKQALMRLFPRLEAVWNNVHYSDDELWARERRVCSEAHFDAYFRFSLGDEALGRAEIDELINRADDVPYVHDIFGKALATQRSDGRTKASLLLDELKLHAKSVPDEKVAPLLTALFEIADDLQVQGDKATAFLIGDNLLRLHWLLRRLTLERFDLAKRSSVLTAACQKASLGWLIDISDSAYRDYHPLEGKNPETEANCLTTLADAEKLHELALKRIRAASKTGQLLNHGELPYLLFRWCDEEAPKVLKWTAAQLKQDKGAVRFAHAFTAHSWVHSLGDRVARREIRASLESIERILDKDIFRARLEELAVGDALGKDDAVAVRTFLQAWDRGLGWRGREE